MQTGEHPVVLCGGRMFMQALDKLASTAGKPYRVLVPKVPDDVLISSIAVGDKHAMVLLFMRHNVRIHRFVMRLTGKASIAEDIVSEVFLDIWRGAAEFSGKSNVSTWLLGIARNKTMSALRRRTEAMFDYDVAAKLVDDADDPEAAADRASRGAVVRRCLTRLPAPLREIVDLIYYHEKTVTEVAQIVGIPPGTVKTRMFHARSRLQEMLAHAGVHCALAD
jgi:RNA polymerase sigma-70 factor, ECF subfamily